MYLGFGFDLRHGRTWNGQIGSSATHPDDEWRTVPPMTLDDARTQLDLIDHDFYLFRDSESGELQVIYRRNHGGYGVIQARN